MFRIALLAILLPISAQALADDRNRSFVQSELRHQYALKVDVTELSENQFWAIYLEITSPRKENVLRTRQRIKAIIRRGETF